MQLFSHFLPTVLALGSSAIVSGGFKMIRLFSGVLGSKWFSPPKRFFGVFPKLFCTFVSESPAVFGGNGCCFRNEVRWRVPPTILYICLPNSCCLKKILWNPPSIVLGSKLGELLACLNHTNPVRRKRPITSLPLGYSLGFLFFTFEPVLEVHFGTYVEFETKMGWGASTRGRFA